MTVKEKAIERMSAYLILIIKRFPHKLFFYRVLAVKAGGGS
jgi:hypothetical protein